ncbi:MAG: type II secretion system protein [Candidatus Staskawiczbacteria bacterium]|jgi:prepilin-type N-terminal cleavage/methylation domain-containing protein
MQGLQGFTIIELIVVITIIAVLASIVMVNVFIYIQKAKDASISANINSMMKDSVIYLSEHGSYSGFFNDSSYTNPKAAIIKKYTDYLTERMDGSSDAYCACYGVVNGSNKDTICIDSSGYNKEMIYNKDCGWRCQNNGACQN